MILNMLKTVSVVRTAYILSEDSFQGSTVRSTEELQQAVP